MQFLCTVFPGVGLPDQPGGIRQTEVPTDSGGGIPAGCDMRVWCRGAVCAAIAMLMSVAAGRAQVTGEQPPPLPPREDVPGVISTLAPLLVPKIMQDDYLLRDYLRSEEFASVRRRFGDVYAVDFIFAEAERLSWNNTYEALLIAFFAVMDHSKVGVRLPALGPLLWLPLTSEFGDDYEKRLRGLPRRLYADTPRGTAGDRDKLQHFFGSAFLTYLFDSAEAADRVGNSVEWWEDLLIVGGVSDPRDVRANRQGQEWALRLREDADARPSAVFMAPLQERRENQESIREGAEAP